MHCTIEKSLDCASVGAVGHADIRQFYDSVRLLRILRFLVRHGVCPSLAAACLRHQLLPVVHLPFSGSCIKVEKRSVGSLTGSRLAGMCARVPVKHLCFERSDYWKQFGFVTPRGTLSASTYVDNLFVAGKSCFAVAQILDDAADFLSSW